MGELERIELFIDENKALMKRMYGEFQMSTEYGPPRESRRTNKREAPSLPGVPDLHGPPVVDPATDKQSGESYFSKLRQTRQSSSFRNNQSSESGRVDACESKVEIVTPYWASNSAGKIRAIVNTQHFEQAIHQEVCSLTERAIELTAQTINQNIANQITSRVYHEWAPLELAHTSYSFRLFALELICIGILELTPDAEDIIPHDTSTSTSVTILDEEVFFAEDHDPADHSTIK
uniref:Spaetzle domain-containing protein n=1 Tax=Timema cristinae TaxID=61476 RepID=A0A7R9DJR0_TIMCR|nr:unnamed protein product [Timema cristinae]